MARQVINKKQTQDKALYEDQFGNKLLFDKKLGYFFSDDSVMDATVEHYLKMGFKLVGEKKKKESINLMESESKQTKSIFSNKENKKKKDRK